MAGFIPAIHAFLQKGERKTWMRGSSPRMTGERQSANLIRSVYRRACFVQAEGPQDGL